MSRIGQKKSDVGVGEFPNVMELVHELQAGSKGSPIAGTGALSPWPVVSHSRLARSF
jgi:hypothetical protein